MYLAVVAGVIPVNLAEREPTDFAGEANEQLSRRNRDDSLFVEVAG